MIKAIALDDEQPALDVIDAFCSRIAAIDLVKTFTKTGEARIYMEKNPVDLIFLDINMPRESGLEFSRALNQQTMVIFTTAYSEYAVESYEIQAVDYLLKPFTFDRFSQSVQRAASQMQVLNKDGMVGAEAPHLYLRVDYGLVKILIGDILFVEGLDNYLKIHIKDAKPVVVRMTMKALHDKLPEAQFARVHRSYIVSVDKIRAIRHKLIQIQDEEIPIGSSYEEPFMARFSK